ncbi:MAG TPA: ribbon-helix-helix protein, CopG family [Candidatus Jeotgalibaca merdavium]|jgi:predicted CopG family antitoxin|uniref:Ribbon-helix-helix protein, CopG family n=1 Tax=Candidatus Jeotgalibaca merdavium TaxID=2838627 RepID=A0A9D2I162_9LACT|nr:ribbon-helix-helix protein, CopG family [Candidatus Coprovivens excrementavium]HJA90355.1 ribbon-helix-helix protein, CopG family [Candidatus Jeotgalibaca merdavium]|tara:strand:+ start:62 stop:235 length:174 start_codon:yes stop_codon:yes gene_type:complete
MILERRDDVDNHKKRLTITISPNIYEELEKLAKEKGLSKSAMLTIAFENYKKGQKNA